MPFSIEAKPAPPIDAVVTVRLDGIDTCVSCAVTDTILEAATEAGLGVPYSCRQGHCGACMVKLTSGTAESPASPGLSRRDRSRGFILTCQARPTSAALTIDYDN